MRRNDEPGLRARLAHSPILRTARCAHPRAVGEIRFGRLPIVAVHTGELSLSTRGDADMIDITDGVQRVVSGTGIADGLACAFVRGSTAAITTMEHEPGLVADLRALLDRLIPVEGDYEHNRLNRDTNSHAHQRASLVGASEQVPLIGGRLALGTWQQLVLIDFDDRPRERTVIVQVVS